MLPQQIYDVFISFEERSADLYLELSVRFVDNIELSWFWVEMAMEEKQHAGMLQYCKETGMLSDRLPDEEAIQVLASLFKQLGSRVSDPALTVDAAFEVAIDLESSEINEVYRNLTAHIQGPSHIVRKKLELSVQNHFERLETSARRFPVSTAIMRRLAELKSLA